MLSLINSATRQNIINTILRQTGITVTRHQLRTMFKKDEQ